MKLFTEMFNSKTSDTQLKELETKLKSEEEVTINVNKTSDKNVLRTDYVVTDLDTDGGYEPTAKLTKKGRSVKVNLHDITFDIA